MSFTQIHVGPDCCLVHEIPFCGGGGMKLLENMGTEDVLFSFPFSHAQLCLVSLRFFFFPDDQVAVCNKASTGESSSISIFY